MENVGFTWKAGRGCGAGHRRPQSPTHEQTGRDNVVNRVCVFSLGALSLLTISMAHVFAIVQTHHRYQVAIGFEEFLLQIVCAACLRDNVEIHTTTLFKVQRHSEDASQRSR